MSSERSDRVSINGIALEVRRRGKGSPVLVLCGEEELEFDSSWLSELAQKHELILPSAPGFGQSERPDWVSNVDDLSYIYLDLVEKLGLQTVPVVGFSFGGWLATEIAVKDDSFISKLVLVAPYGVKLGGPLERDIADIWSLPPADVLKRKWHDPEKGKRDFPSLPEETLRVVARNVESLARFCWDPYMHNPRLRHRLHRITVPTLVIWGDKDGIMTPAFGKSYAGLIPGAHFKTVANAGHYPHLEQPAAFNAVLEAFIG